MMEHQVFFNEDFSAEYSKLPLINSMQFLERIISYLMEKKGTPLELAVDVGCGTGRSTRVLAPYFTKVIGTDISETQINQAQAIPSPKNISYRVCPADALDLEDNSVDLLTAVMAAHWFEVEPFIKEMDRVLKPGGCVALTTGIPRFELNYKDCSDQLTSAFKEAMDILEGFLSDTIWGHFYNQYEDFYNAILYPDKERITDTIMKQKMNMSGAMELLRGNPMYHSLKSENPSFAEELAQKTEQRFRDILQDSFDHAVMDVTFPHFLVLACKPNPRSFPRQPE